MLTLWGKIVLSNYYFLKTQENHLKFPDTLEIDT